MGTCCCNTNDPPGIWGPNDPRPTPPIYLPPPPGSNLPPLVIWGPNDPRPTPPIWLPKPPELPIPPDPPEGIQGPLPEDYSPPANDGSNYYVARPGVTLATGPVGYLITPLWPEGSNGGGEGGSGAPVVGGG